MDKLILLSELFQVTLDYLIKDSSNEEASPTQGEVKFFMNSVKIKEYLDEKKKFSYLISGAVSFIILSVILPILTADTKQENLGAFMMLACVGVAVAVIIFTGINYDKYSEIEKKEINMSFNDLQDLQTRQAKFKSKFGMGIALGVGLIILSVASIVLLDEMSLDEKVAPTQLMICVAIAVFMFINLGIKDSAYNFLVQNKKFIKEKKQEENSLFAITMPLAAMVFLVLGFTKDWWHPAWIVFPITAIITSGIEGVRKKCDDD